MVLEGNKLYRIHKNKKKRIYIYSWVYDRKDWEALRSWVAENKPVDEETYPLHVGPVGKGIHLFKTFCRRWYKPILKGFAVGLIACAAWWGKGIWDRNVEIQRLFDRAEAALNREDWHEAVAAGEELYDLLRFYGRTPLDRESHRVRDLLSQARTQLSPRLVVRVTWNGEEVAATVRLKKRMRLEGTSVLPGTLDIFESHQPYHLFFSYEEHGDWYQAGPVEIFTDWEGVREMDVPMEPYMGPAPVPGEDWRSPATGMEFVWIEDLEIWVGKYEATNEEYRKMNPDHDSGAYEGHSLNGDRQPVVQVSFKDAVAFASWMTHLEYEAENLPTCYRYRLPSDREFQTLMGGGGRQRRPWGNQWPPPKDLAVNYSGEESLLNEKIEGYRDAFIVSAPVDDLWINPLGLAGVGGNVWEVTSNRGKKTLQQVFSCQTRQGSLAYAGDPNGPHR